MKRLFCSVFAILIFADYANADASSKKPSVMVETVHHQQLSDRLLYPASLAAFRIVPVHTDAEGLVSDLRIELGQSVRSGETLALITNPDPISGFKPYALTAPISGLVTTLDIAVGDRVTKERVVLVIADLRSYKVKIHLTAADLLLLKPKDEGTVKFQSKSFKVRIRVMSPMIDPATGTAACELEIIGTPSELKSLVPGSLGQVVFDTNKRNGIIVPDDALAYKGKDPFVVRVSPQTTAEYVPIKILHHSVGQVEIESALKDGEVIVTGSTGYIVEGEALDVQRPKDDKAPESKGNGK